MAILGVGSTKMACLVLRLDGVDPSGGRDGVGALAGQSRFRVIGAATTRSRGVAFGEIEAMAETERAIRTVVSGAQKMAQVRVDHVIACLSDGRPRPYGLDSQITLTEPPISEQDVGRALGS